MSNPTDMNTSRWWLYRVLLLLAFFVGKSCFSQTLFSIDGQQTSKAEFLQAYRKNNGGAKPSQKAYRAYLDLYIRYKLKVKAAYDLKLDTLSSQVAELQNFRRQIIDSYLNNPASINRMIQEAFERSQRDIHLGEIFLRGPASSSAPDSLLALQHAREVYAMLKKGMKFADAALSYSADPQVKSNQGDIGYITIFSLPYELENLAYTTKPGQISALYRTPSGYVIFKNLGERKAWGRIKAAQILVAFPPGADDPMKAACKKRADSLCQVLRAGGDFASLARKYSGDNLTYQIGGEMPEFGIGHYEPDFERTAYALQVDGQISDPTASNYGYHIIKRLARRPPAPQLDKKTSDFFRQLIMNDKRLDVARSEMAKTMFKMTNCKELPLDSKKLWAFTDSMLQNKMPPPDINLQLSTTLLSFPKQDLRVKDWIDYRKSIRKIPVSTQSPQKSNEEIYSRFKDNAVADYYRNHLEEYNEDFDYQLREFKDGNLLFDIMQRMVWNKATKDSAGLMAYYRTHQSKYQWQSSADAIVFTFSSEKVAGDWIPPLSRNITFWRRLTDSAGGQIQFDSGRFELSQLPMSESGPQRAGKFTSLIKGQTENSVTAAYLLRLYPQASPRSFQQSRGLVENDFQNYLEEKWIAELRVKYPVKINQAVLNSLAP